MDTPAFIAATAGGNIATPIPISISAPASASTSTSTSPFHRKRESPAADQAVPVSSKRPRLAGSNDSCSTCRLRKIKCSGRPGNELGISCEKCAKASIRCGFVGDVGEKVARVTPTQDLTEAGTRRKRAQRACEACHSHKTKCSGEVPKCKRCLENNINCEYKVSRRKLASTPGPSPITPRNPVQNVAPPPPVAKVEAKQLISPSASSVSPGLTDMVRKPSVGNVLTAEDLLARTDLLLRHFDVWLDTWGSLPLMAILHPQQTYREIQDGTMNPYMARAMCAVTTRFIHPGSKTLPLFAERCAEDMDQYVLQHISAVLKAGDGLENLLILLTTICHFWVESQMGKVWMYMGLAGRFITALQMNWEGAVDTPVRQEILRRAVWTVWKLDRYLASGFDEHLILRDEVMHLRPPTTDYGFPSSDNTNVGGTLPSLAHSLQTPLCVYHIQLQRARHHILGVTKKLADPPTPHPRTSQLEPSQFLNQVNKLQNMLLNFNQTLPEHLKASDTTIERFIGSKERGSFVMMYTTFWEMYIDLYRFSIPGLREEASADIAKQLPPDFVVKSQKQAVGYAVSLSRFWRTAHNVVAKKPWVDGRERLLTHDQTLIVHIIQVTKVLLAARQHHLYNNLGENSSAPLIHDEVVNDDTLAALVYSNMKLFDAFSVFYPESIEIHTRDLRTAVDGVQQGTPYDNPRETIGMPARKPPMNVRLPGPHYMLEQAIAPLDYEDRIKHRNRSGADALLRQRRPLPIIPPAPSTIGPSQNETSTPSQRPNIPGWLAEARSVQPASSTLGFPQQTAVAPSPAPSQNAVGHGAASHPVYGSQWPTPAMGPYNPTVASPATNAPHYVTPMLDEHPGYYHRAGGKTLPFPDINSII